RRRGGLHPPGQRRVPRRDRAGGPPRGAGRPPGRRAHPERRRDRPVALPRARRRGRAGGGAPGEVAHRLQGGLRIDHAAQRRRRDNRSDDVPAGHAALRAPAAPALPLRGRVAPEPGDRRLDELELVRPADELAELDADEAPVAGVFHDAEHLGDRDDALAVRNRAGAGDRIVDERERLDVLEMYELRPRRELARRRARLVADSKRVRGVEADAERLVPDQVEKLDQLGCREVAVVLDRETQSTAARLGGGGREHSGSGLEALARYRTLPEPRARRDAADERAAEPAPDVEPLDELRDRAVTAAELEPVRVSPGEHELQRPGGGAQRLDVHRRGGAEETGLERDAVDAEPAGMV